jgi:AcrR family transcriptional regulator
VPVARRQPRATRERLVEAALELFWAQGFEATGIAAILARAGVRSGSLYHFFRGKEELLVAVLQRYLEQMEPVLMEPIFRAHADPIERIFALIGGYRELLLHTGCSRGCPIGNLALEKGDASPEAARLIAANFTAWRGHVERCLEAAAPRLLPDVDRRGLAELVLVVMEGGVMLARAHRSLEPFDRAVAQLRDYFRRLERPRRKKP